MMDEKKKQIAVFLLCQLFLFWHLSASALAISDIQLNSHLNQKLNAEVQLISVTTAELDQLDIRIVQESEEEGQLQQRSGLSIEIAQYPSGQHYLQILSDQVIREPIVTFKLELSWPDGRLERKYVLLIDPETGLAQQ